MDKLTRMWARYGTSRNLKVLYIVLSLLALAIASAAPGAGGGMGSGAGLESIIGALGP